MPDLKSCPFCGGTAEFRQTGYGTENGSVFLNFRISCKRCGATAPGASDHVKMNLRSDGHLNVCYDGRGTSEQAWNRRSNDAEIH